MRTATHDGTVHPFVVLTTGGGPTNADTFDITFDGNVTIGGKFGMANCLLSAAVTPMASSTTAATLVATAVKDTSNMFDGTSNVTIPRNGTYEIGMLGTWQAQAVAAGYRGMQFAVNGVTSRRHKFPTNATVNTEIIGANLITELSLNSGDSISFLALQNSGAALNFTSDLWVKQVQGT